MSLVGQALGMRHGSRVLFEQVNVTVEPGTMTAVVGPNGAGKSTLLRGLAGLQALEGEVVIEGTPLRQHTPQARARALAYLPQHTPSSTGLSVHDVVSLGRLPHRSRFAGPSAHDRALVQRCMAQLGIETLAQRRLATLSGGERQRVMLARMLATEASTLLLDEPTAALDVRHAHALLAELRTLANKGAAIVVALHDLSLADHFADRALCLHANEEGTCSAGPTAEVLTPARLHTVFGVQFERDDEGHLRVRFEAGRPAMR